MGLTFIKIIKYGSSKFFSLQKLRCLKIKKKFIGQLTKLVWIFLYRCKAIHCKTAFYQGLNELDKGNVTCTICELEIKGHIRNHSSCLICLVSTKSPFVKTIYVPDLIEKKAQIYDPDLV